MKKIYASKNIGRKKFILAEHVESYVMAQVAAAEYRCEGLYCRIEPVEDDNLYYVWTHPGRLRMPKTLERERGNIRRGSTKFLRRIS